MKNKKVILLLISLTLLVGIVQPGTLAVFAEESAFTCDTESGFYAEASLLYAAPGVLAEEDRICTCNPSPAEGEEHQKDCPLYVEQTWQGEEAEIKYQIVGPENCGTLDNEKELLRLPVSSTETGFADENLGVSGADDLYLISDDNLYLNGDSDMAIDSEHSREAFTRIYGYCFAGCIFMHLFINIGMTIGLMPVIGIPLPFISYGGSSLLSFSLMFFIFMALDKNERKYF